jgi:hypothetical protein
MMKKLLVLLAVLSLSGCASFKHVPEGFAGPTATIMDSAGNISGSKGELFYIESIDGNTIQNARNSTRGASYNTGFSLSTRSETRHVRAGVPMKLVVIGTHVTAAPIHEFASRATGNFFTVTGEIEFVAEPNKKYVVVGSLTKEEASVWIRDTDGNVVSKKIIAK